MEMKWHPIEDGNMKGVPRDKDILFTVCDEYTGEVFTGVGKVDEHFLRKHRHVFIGVTSYPFDAESLKAWAELPEPFTPNDCNRCEHLEEWCDEFGAGRWCELLKNVPFTKIKPGDCPLDR